ncbi:Conserved virulence factor B [Fusobacterium sp. DD29]|uniref:CvfB family protein n=1 Tax=unclassified Fusobacterium TaxID=2648384 RepID=UPI001B8BA607|nr:MULTISPECIES: S1-like domain-containing RNA-binding protein [unclassified Fusobacterium]MBR8700356.1 Conserved virulence factor B [Fusobacterium sp. DD45]MBR8710049.1 Conserved virulence factor B [Fusobacterium sp. DD28]MBR8748349.1 Conserved virulence factor B [Fusobacterium sp. DD29]MBR8750627.1 Conserved virulence factor B [Fusobacterium sp. DD26]MBR8760677.1 Conserved virulence factor B [Fusobacterium sp. DD25]
MIKIGKRQKLKINNFASVGAYLDAETGDSKDNILLPNNELEDRDLKEGDEVEVLVYMDSEDRPVATFRKTEALVGTLAKLEVTDIHPTLGAFMDWGLTKDLLLPKRQQEAEVEIGKKYLVGIYEDSKGRLSATMKIYKFLLPSTSMKKNDVVTGTVYRINPEIGVFVAVEDRYFGLIPKNEYFKEYKVGDEIEARVIRVREDGKLDLSPRELAYLQADKDAELILEKMRLLKDSFRFNDKTSSEQIVDYFNMSKKAFKRAIGNLLKHKKIEKTEDGYFRIVKK